MTRLAARIVRAVVFVTVVAVLLWSVVAISIDGPSSRVLAAALSAVVAAAGLASLTLIRPWPRGSAAALVPVAVVLAWWLSIPPSNARDWSPDVARLATAEIEGDRVTIHNVRNFAYPSPTSVVEHWETRTYDLSRIEGFADERDVIGVRAGPRQEDVYLYRLRANPRLARALLLDYLAEVNRLARKPEWYNAVTHNCTTTIRHHAQQVAARNPFDWRILANGHLDEMGYERRMLNTSLPFPELRRRSDISALARAADGSADFSRLIREGLPDRPR